MLLLLLIIKLKDILNFNVNIHAVNFTVTKLNVSVNLYVINFNVNVNFNAINFNVNAIILSCLLNMEMFYNEMVALKKMLLGFKESDLCKLFGSISENYTGSRRNFLF